MKRYRFYLDTSVCGFLFEEEAITKRDITQAFFVQEKEGKFQIFTSALVVDEINRIPLMLLRDNLLSALNEHNPLMLAYNEEIEQLAEKMVKMGAVPSNFFDDALHLGYAIFYELDGIISWNMKHIVRLHTRRIVSALCKIEGLKELEILTPEEVIYD